MTGSLAEVERPLISICLAATRGNQIRAAQLLGLNRNTLRKKIRDLGLEVIKGLAKRIAAKQLMRSVERPTRARTGAVQAPSQGCRHSSRKLEYRFSNK